MERTLVHIRPGDYHPPMSITYPQGYRAAGGVCGVKASGKPDLAMIVSDRPAKLAVMFTTNAVVGAPVIVGRDHARGGRCRAFVCNAGVANVATGSRGVADALNMCGATAEAIGSAPQDVLPFSTGVIGRPLPIEHILGGIARLAADLKRGPAADRAVAEAILTTDLVAKTARRHVMIGNHAVRLGGVAKGSGMIAPNMATMLVFLTSDAAISVALLRRALRRAVNADASFNRITVDSDTSTSDTVAIMANGASSAPSIRKADRNYERFAAALVELCQDLAYQVIADGEGAEHVIRVRVGGAASEPDALRVARSVADSPLVKTAVHGGDPNWGRLAMAAGKSGANVDPNTLTLRIGDQLVFRKGRPIAFDAPAAAREMRRREVVLGLDLGQGRGTCEVLGCDLSKQYITINADYHT